MGMPGGWGDEKSPTEEEVAVLMGLKGDIETALGKTCDIFEAIAYVTQVVAGTNYKFKVRIADAEFAHVTIFQPLPHTGQAPSLTSAEGGKADGDVL